MNSFICWTGGKRLLRKKILEQFPQEYDRYIEVFGGAGWVLFGKEKKTMEVYNDINSNLVNLYRCVKYHSEALQKELSGILMSRELFIEAIQEVEGLTDIQRAARFYIVIKESFGGQLRNFRIGPRNMKNAVDFFTEISVRLQSTVIENMDFERLIKTYDRVNALFYCDPPYYQTEKYYPDRFQEKDHIRLRNTLKDIKGKFVLSYNDCKEIKELYKEFNIIEVERQNNLACKNKGRYKELIIKNY